MREGYNAGRAGDNRAIATNTPTDPAPSRQARCARVLARIADWIVPDRNPSGAVYGVIVIGALLAAESGQHESYLDAFASAAVAAALYWLAHAYAGILGARLAAGTRLSGAALFRALAHDWALIRGASLPLLALLGAAVAGATEETAVSVAVWSSVACLFGFELIAGLRSRAKPGELALEVAVSLTMGVAILALKVILH
jgi:hypothetical protein